MTQQEGKGAGAKVGAAIKEAEECLYSPDLERRCRENCKQCPHRAEETWVGCHKSQEVFLLDEQEMRRALSPLS